MISYGCDELEIELKSLEKGNCWKMSPRSIVLEYGRNESMVL